MNDWTQFLGVPYRRMNCYELTQAVCALYGRHVPSIEQQIVSTWTCGDDIEPIVESHRDETTIVPLSDARAGDAVLLGDSTAVRSIAPVVAPGLMLTTGAGQASRVVRILGELACIRCVMRFPSW